MYTSKLKEEKIETNERPVSAFSLTLPEFFEDLPVVLQGPPTFELVTENIKIVRISAMEIKKTEWTIRYQEKHYIDKYFNKASPR